MVRANRAFFCIKLRRASALVSGTRIIVSSKPCSTASSFWLLGFRRSHNTYTKNEVKSAITSGAICNTQSQGRNESYLINPTCLNNFSRMSPKNKNQYCVDQCKNDLQNEKKKK